jgi:two-component system sensor histidine kinase KdpD
VSRFVRARRIIGAYALALVLVGAVTVVIAGIRQASDVDASMVYLLAVIGSAIAFGRGPAIVAAIASFLAYNFFFIQPHYTFRVGDDEEWVALALLLMTGVITAQLAAMLRERVTHAERREKEAVVLYDMVRLMADPDVESAFTAVAHRLRSELHLSAVLIVSGNQGGMTKEAAAGDARSMQLARDSIALPDKILGGGTQATTGSTAAPGRWIRVIDPRSARSRMQPGQERVSSVPIASDGERLGALILVRDADAPSFSRVDDRLLSAVASQLGLAVQRLRLQREANEAEALRRTDELRTALLNAVSHDLRTPLSSIMASAGSLLQTDVVWSDAERVDFARAVLDESRRLDRLVSNLLNLSRIEAGSIRPEKGWYDLPSLCNEVAGRLRPITAPRGVILNAPEDMPPIPFDYVHIDQVLTNLLENAAKHTPAATEIRIAVHLTGDGVEVSVSDAGPGLPPLATERIFKPFYRPADSHAPGTGLGLAVAKGLVEANGGRIWAENLRGGGARFAFTLPIVDQPAAAA